DLLCCALGGMLLVCYLLIVSIGSTSRAGFRDAYFMVSAGVWIDLTESAAREFEKQESWQKLMQGTGPISEEESASLPGLDRLREECEVQLEVYWRRAGESPAVPRSTKPLCVVNTSQERS